MWGVERGWGIFVTEIYIESSREYYSCRHHFSSYNVCYERWWFRLCSGTTKLCYFKKWFEFNWCCHVWGAYSVKHQSNFKGIEWCNWCLYEGWKEDGSFLSLISIYNLLGNVTRADIIFHPTMYVMRGGGFVLVLYCSLCSGTTKLYCFKKWFDFNWCCHVWGAYSVKHQSNFKGIEWCNWCFGTI